VRAAILACALAAACGVSFAEERVPLLEGLGSYRMDAETRVPLAQRYFDQGLAMAFGFNGAESARAFRAAARADPQCALCWWGLAWSLGPNINADMAPGAAAEVRESLSRARAAASSPRERALVEALARRHPREPAPLDEDGYAKTMDALAERHPRDALVVVLADPLLELGGERLGLRGVLCCPRTRFADELFQVIHRACGQLLDRDVPLAATLAQPARQCLEAHRGARDRLLARHERAAAQGAREADHFFRIGRGRLTQRVQPVEVVAGLERKEVRHSHGIRGAHGATKLGISRVNHQLFHAAHRLFQPPKHGIAHD